MNTLRMFEKIKEDCEDVIVFLKIPKIMMYIPIEIYRIGYNSFSHTYCLEGMYEQSIEISEDCEIDIDSSNSKYIIHVNDDILLEITFKISI